MSKQELEKKQSEIQSRITAKLRELEKTSLASADYSRIESQIADLYEDFSNITIKLNNL